MSGVQFIKDNKLPKSTLRRIRQKLNNNNSSTAEMLLMLLLLLLLLLLFDKNIVETTFTASLDKAYILKQSLIHANVGSSSNENVKYFVWQI